MEEGLIEEEGYVIVPDLGGLIATMVTQNTGRRISIPGIVMKRVMVALTINMAEEVATSGIRTGMRTLDGNITEEVCTN